MNYSRQELLPEIGTRGQQKLQSAKVAIVGVGALGTVAAELLARAGIGTILLIDRDVVEESNLQRQLLFEEQDVGKSKAETAKEKLLKINPALNITSETIHLHAQNISLLQNYNIVLDGTDNLQTRFLLDDYCRKNNKPWIYAAAIQTSGYVMPILPGKPCLRDFLRETSGLDTCDTVGVLNTITTIIGSLQVQLALKIILGQKMEAVLQYVDVARFVFKTINIKKQGGHDFRYLEQPAQRVIKFCNAGRYQVFGKPVHLKNVELRWKNLGTVQNDGIVLHLPSRGIALFKDGRALITANNEKEAQALYSKYVGN